MTEAEAVKSILQLQDTPENQGENEQPQVEADDATVEPQTETDVANEVELEASDADDDLLLELDADEKWSTWEWRNRGSWRTPPS